MRPRRLSDHRCLRIERSKTKLLTSNAAILQIKPALSPPANGIDLLQVKIRIFIPNGDTHPTHGILRVRPFYTKKAPPESPMGVNPQESLTKSDETRNVQTPVGSHVVQLEPIGIQQATNERMQRKSKPAVEER